jgi:hypothetical protein
VRRYNAGEFDSIPSQNLFSETRAREEKVEAPAVPETPPLDVKPVLVGINLAGDQRLALMSDPATQGQARKTQTKRLGDTYRGYTIVDITDSQMVLQAGNRREVIPLFDTSKRPQGGKTPIIATRVVSFGGGAGGPAAAVAAATSQATVANVGTPARPAPAVTTNSAVTTIIGREAAAQTQQQNPPPRPGQPQPGRTVSAAPTSSSPGATWNERTDDQGRRVIRTPFGDIVRPEKPPNQ